MIFFFACSKCIGLEQLCEIGLFYVRNVVFHICVTPVTSAINFFGPEFDAISFLNSVHSFSDQN